MVASRSERSDQPSPAKDTNYFIHKLMFNAVALMLDQLERKDIFLRFISLLDL
jgi:hypothetical protein